MIYNIMNKTSLAILASLLCVPSIGEIINVRNKSAGDQAIVPILVDFDQEKLTIQFLDRKDYDIEVVGQEGIVIDRTRSEEDSPVMRINMQDENRGTYEIHFRDEEGNTLSGKFKKE